jgi:predicted acyltransferase
MSARRAKLLAATMAATFAVMRVYLHASPNTDLTVAGYDIHHLFTGLILLTIGGVAAVVLPQTHRLATAALVIFGAGLALALDEWLYLIVTDGTNASYLLPVSFWGGLAAVSGAVIYALGIGQIKSPK